MTAAAKPLHVLRSVLRNLKTELPEHLAQKTNGPNPTRAFVLEQYRTQVSSPDEQANRRRLASEFLALQEDLKERNRLYELDTGAESVLTPKEMSRRAAARAGLQLPDLNPKLD